MLKVKTLLICVVVAVLAIALWKRIGPIGHTPSGSRGVAVYVPASARPSAYGTVPGMAAPERPVGKPSRTVKAADLPGFEGIYLVGAGMDYLIVDLDEEGYLQIQASSFPSSDFFWGISKQEGRLRLLSSWRQTVISRIYEMVPSSSINQDWDLVGLSQTPGPLGQEFREPEWRTLEAAPLVSFLHRVDDRRIVEYYEELGRPSKTGAPGESGADPERLFELASGLLEAHPGDMYLRGIYLDALARKEDTAQLEKSIADWRPIIEAGGNPLLVERMERAERALEALQLSEAGQNAFDFMEGMLGGKADLETWIRDLPRILGYSRYASPYPVVERSSIVVPNFLPGQILAKVMLTEAALRLSQGKADEGLELLKTTYHFGQLLNGDNSLIARLIGIAVRGISCRGLALYALDVGETPAELEPLWETLEWLNERHTEASEEDCLSPVPYLGRSEGEAMVAEMMTRHKVADAKFQNVRVAAAARHRLLFEGAFPGNAEAFAPFLPEGPPRDPFSGASMKYLSSPGLFVTYSVGPDEQDDRARVAYDPTNGTVSQGDVFLKVLPEREFPFPKVGVRATTAEDFLRQFPNGLPSDPFGPRRPRPEPLLISKTTPVYIYSRGPDKEVDTGNSLERFVPENHYDPTNGTISSGDLFVEIPQ